MVVFEWIVALLGGAVLLAGLARRVGAPYPAFLAVGGAVLAMVPGGPRLALDPALALALFVAPVLLDAAYDASLRDLRDNWAPLAGLIVAAVVVTTFAVAVIARALRPEISFSVAVVLGAIVAPPDAAAATAVLRQVRPPHRILMILQGESLLNDAVALLIYRLGVTAVTAAAFRPAVVVPQSLLAIAGSVVTGIVLARLWTPLLQRVTDTPSSIVLQFVSTFGVWMLAERAHLSGVLTIVTYAITLARRRPDPLPARLRVPSFAVWDTVVFVLNVLAFVLIGLQIRPIFERLSAAQRAQDLKFAAIILATVIVVRIVWCMTYNTVVRWKIRRYGLHQPRPMMRPTVRGGLIISWCGMRGIVTLAAALALPVDFPQRGLIVLTAFAVVVGTLLVQGLTLRPLVVALDLHDDNPVEREVRLARCRGLQVALDSFAGDSSPEAEALRAEYESAQERLRDPSEPVGPAATLPSDRLRRHALAAARDAVSELRARGDIGDDAYHVLQEELDRLELSVDPG